MASDPLLSAVSHVVVDEVHERTMQGDFLMALLRGIICQRRQAMAAAAADVSRDGSSSPAVAAPLKVVLMSATLDASLYCQYYGGCPGKWSMLVCCNL